MRRRARRQAREQEGEAAGEEESGGERPVAAAPGDAPLETDIREKPEPGEETGPSRQAGSPAPQPRTGRAAIGPKSSLSEGTSFLGADSNDSGFIPPDSMGAVGPTQVLVSVNGRLRAVRQTGKPGPEPGRHRLGLLGLPPPARCGADRPGGRVRPALRALDRLRDRHPEHQQPGDARCQRRPDDHRRDQLRPSSPSTSPTRSRSRHPPGSRTIRSSGSTTTRSTSA